MHSKYSVNVIFPLGLLETVRANSKRRTSADEVLIMHSDTMLRSGGQNLVGKSYKEVITPRNAYRICGKHILWDHKRGIEQL